MNKKKVVQMEWPPELLVRLREAQTESGYLSEEVITELVRSFGLPVNDIYGVATF